jgi:hypothetical protein
MNPESKLNEKINYDLEREMKKIAEKFSAIRQSYNFMRKKMNLQKGKKIDIAAAIEINLMERQMDLTQSKIDDVIIALDNQGYWDLDENDVQRIESSLEADRIFKQFLPEMVYYQQTNHKKKDFFYDKYLKNACIIL